MNQTDFQDLVIEKLDNLEDRLFKDNGSPCLQSKVNSNTRNLKIVASIFSAVGVFILGIVTFFTKKQIGE